MADTSRTFKKGDKVVIKANVNVDKINERMRELGYCTDDFYSKDILEDIKRWQANREALTVTNSNFLDTKKLSFVRGDNDCGHAVYKGFIDRYKPGDVKKAKPATPKFKVGDKVRAISNAYGVTNKMYNWEGVVTEVYGDGDFKAETTKCDKKSCIGHRYTWLDSQDFELVEEAKPEEAKEVKEEAKPATYKDLCDSLDAAIEALKELKAALGGGNNDNA